MAPKGDNLAEGAVVRVARCVLNLAPESWPFEVRQADEIAVDRERCRSERRKLYDGVVYLLRTCTLEHDVFTATFLRTDFKSFLNWRALGYPEAGSGPHTSIAAEWRSALPSDTLKAYILEHARRQPGRKLADVAIGRSRSDIDAHVMPGYATLLLSTLFAA